MPRNLDDDNRMRDFSATSEPAAKRSRQGKSSPLTGARKARLPELLKPELATTICAYAVRTREGMPVSMPIWREEVGELKGANQWNLHNVHERLVEVGG